MQAMCAARSWHLLVRCVEVQVAGQGAAQGAAQLQRRGQLQRHHVHVTVVVRRLPARPASWHAHRRRGLRRGSAADQAVLIGQQRPCTSIQLTPYPATA